VGPGLQVAVVVLAVAEDQLLEPGGDELEPAQVRLQGLGLAEGELGDEAGGPVAEGVTLLEVRGNELEFGQLVADWPGRPG